MATSREQRLANSRQEDITRRRKLEEPIGIKSPTKSLTAGRAVVLMASAKRSAKIPRESKSGIHEAIVGHIRRVMEETGLPHGWERGGGDGGAQCDGDLRGRRARPSGGRLALPESPG